MDGPDRPRIVHDWRDTKHTLGVVIVVNMNMKVIRVVVRVLFAKKETRMKG